MTPNNLPCFEGDPNLMLIFGALRPIIVHIFMSKGHALRRVTVRRGLDRPDNCGGGADNRTRSYRVGVQVRGIPSIAEMHV